MNNRTFAILKTPIEKGSGETLDKLCVNIDYHKGGVNYFSGDVSDSGVYVFITPCTYENGIFGCVITGNMHKDGYKILLKQINRKSQKQIDLMVEKVLPHAQEIADLYSAMRHDKVYELIQKLI